MSCQNCGRSHSAPSDLCPTCRAEQDEQARLLRRQELDQRLEEDFRKAARNLRREIEQRAAAYQHDLHRDDDDPQRLTPRDYYLKLDALRYCSDFETRIPAGHDLDSLLGEEFQRLFDQRVKRAREAAERLEAAPSRPLRSLGSRPMPGGSPKTAAAPAPAVESRRAVYLLVAFLALALLGFTAYIQHTRSQISLPASQRTPASPGALALGQQYLAQAKQALNRKDWKAALRAIQTASDLIEPLPNVDPRKAKEVRELAFKIKARSAEAWTQQARIHIKRQQWREALPLIQDSLELWKGVPQSQSKKAALLALEGKIQSALGNPDLARDAFRKAEQLQPGHGYQQLARQLPNPKPGGVPPPPPRVPLVTTARPSQPRVVDTPIPLPGYLDQLDLSSDQQEKIRQIIREARTSGLEREAISAQIGEVLTPDQRSQYRLIREKNAPSYSQEGDHRTQ